MNGIIFMYYFIFLKTFLLLHADRKIQYIIHWQPARARARQVILQRRICNFVFPSSVLE